MASPAVPAEDTNMPRHHCLYMAKLANQAEQYNDMAKFMSEIITNHSANLTLEERTLFSAAYKKLADSLREACRIALFNEHEELSRVEEDPARMARLHGSLVASRLDEVCAGVLDLLDARLIPAVEAGEESEGKVYYMKMKGDYFRYLAEVKTGEERSVAVEKALHAYNAAEVFLSQTHLYVYLYYILKASHNFKKIISLSQRRLELMTLDNAYVCLIKPYYMFLNLNILLHVSQVLIFIIDILIWRLFIS